MNLWKCIIVAFVSLLAFSCSKPASSNNTKRIDDLITHLKAQGIKVTGKDAKEAGMIGAAEGCAINVGKASYEVYKYDTDVAERRKDLDKYEKEGLTSFGMHVTIIRNGSFILIPPDTASDDWRKFEAAFRSFGTGTPPASPQSEGPTSPTPTVGTPAASPSTPTVAKTMKLTRGYVHSVSQRGHTARMEGFEFWNDSDKPVQAIKGTVLVSDPTTPNRIALRCPIAVEFEAPLEPNGKIFLFRVYRDNVEQDHTWSKDDLDMALKPYAKEMGVSVRSLGRECEFKQE